MKKKDKLSDLYIDLFMQKYKDDVSLFLSDIENESHIFWECCRDYVREKSYFYHSANWLGVIVDDCGILVERYMINKLGEWKSKRTLKTKIHSLKAVLLFLFERYVSQLKNLFNNAYRNHIKHIVFTTLDEESVFEELNYYEDIQEINILESFSKLNLKMKVEILTMVWNQSLYDSEFDLDDMKYLCEQYKAPSPEQFLDLKHNTDLGVEKTDSGNFQIVLIF